MANNKIRIRLKSFDHKILDNSAEKIIGAAKKSGAQDGDNVAIGEFEFDFYE